MTDTHMDPASAIRTEGEVHCSSHDGVAILRLGHPGEKMVTFT